MKRRAIPWLCAVAIGGVAFSATPVRAGDEGGDQQDEAARAKREQRRRAAQERRRKARDARILNAKALEKGIAPHVTAIFECYREHALGQRKASRAFRIELIIQPNGRVKKIWVRAPGVKGKGLDKCIGTLWSAWRFEQRPGFTHAAIPFYFLKTKTRGAGPRLGTCWNRKSCARARRREQAANANKETKQ